MIFRYILSFFLLIGALNSADIEVIESFDTNPQPVIEQTVIQTPQIVRQKSVTKTQEPKANRKEANISKKTLSKKAPKKELKQKIEEKKVYKKSKAKLVIIIDDVSHMYQLYTIKALPFKVTPSIFPPTRMNMQSYKLAKGLKHFMVHLPLESHSRQMNTIYKLLRVNATQKQINARVKEIRKLFPNDVYINNHTGSVFTSNYKASKKLYKALIDNGFIFVDSKTTPNTQIPRIAKEFHKRYIKSDFFLDNILSVSAIEKRIKEAVALAKKKGYAVVIGHPHPQTFQALRNMAKLIQSVQTVYIDEL